MKFRQRQIVLSILLLCGAIVLLLHSRTPEDNDLVLHPKVPGAPLTATLTATPRAQNIPLDPPPGKRDPGDEGQEDEAASMVFVQRSPAGGECPNVLRPAGEVKETQTFQKVDNETGLYVFSAFLDEKEKGVRVVGLNSWKARAVFCLLWYDSGDPELRVVKNIVENLPEHHAKRRAFEIVEMIELNRMLGADQFTFYVHSMGDNVAKVLRWYQRQGLVQLVSWNLPVRVDHWPPDRAKPTEVHYFAQLASHNDCLNRHRGRSRYLVYQDLDEFIIPKRHLTWDAMLRSLNTNTSAFLFKCVFFRKDWPHNEENFTGRAIADKLQSIVLSVDKREPKYFPHGQRAKYIIDPLGIQTVGIHNIWKYRSPAKSLTNVFERDALLHHYRGWENPADKHRAVRDTDMYRFKDELLRRLQERWSMLPDVPLDIPIATYGQV